MDKNDYESQVKRVAHYEDIITKRGMLVDSLQKANIEETIYVGGIGIRRKRDQDSFDAVLRACSKYMDTLDDMIDKI